MPEASCKLYCEIDSGGVVIYAQSVAIDTIKPMEDREVEFPDTMEFLCGRSRSFPWDRG
jgi:hypothetical protein